MFRSFTGDRYPIIIPSSFNGYKIIKPIGNGQFSVTALVEIKDTKQQLCAKIISKRDMANKQKTHLIENEVSILQSINHPNIIKFYEAFNLENEFGEEFIIIITEYCPNGDLLDFICQNDFQDEIEMKKILYEILKAIQYIHQRGIYHCDIKPENILLDYQMRPKLCDFGNAKTHIMSNNNDNICTLNYSPPEYFKHDNFNLVKSDIYSLGITLYAISKKDFPFDCEDERYIAYQIKNGYLSLNPDDEIQYIVGQCTKFNPDDRISIDELLNFSYFNFN